MDYTRLVINEKKELKDLISKLDVVREPSQRIALLRALIQNLQFNQPDIAKDYAQELLDLGLQKRNQEILGIACNVFAIAEINHGDFRKAKLYCYQALDALDEKSEPFIITCRNLAEILTNQGKYDEAYDYLMLSQATQAVLNLSFYEPFTNAQIAKIYYRKGKYKDAFDICLNNLRKYREHTPLDGWEAVTHHVMGLIYAAQNEYKLSLDNYLKSVSLWKQLDNQYQVTGLYSNIGSIYIYQNNLTSAERYFQKALQVDKEHGGNTKMQSLIYQNLAIVNVRSQKIEKAKAYYDMALRLCKMINDQLGEMQLLYNMATMYKENPKKAIEYYENSLKIASDIQDTRFIMHNNESLSNTYAELEEYKKAYLYKITAQKLERELFGMEKTKAIKDVETQYRDEWQIKEMQLLETRNEELKAFVQRATHELKEPLRMINSFGKILNQRYLIQLDDKGQEYLSYIIDFSEYLGRIMVDLVDYTIVGVDITKLIPIDTNDCLLTAIRNLETIMSKENTEITTPPLPIIRCNKIVLIRLFQSIIENSIKFKKDNNPFIEINSEENLDNIIISIKDNGIGIATTHHERVLGIFEKVHSNKTYDGNGIGLAICQKIMQSIKGRLWLESTLGEGTTVFLQFPK